MNRKVKKRKIFAPVRNKARKKYDKTDFRAKMNTKRKNQAYNQKSQEQRAYFRHRPYQERRKDSPV